MTEEIAVRRPIDSWSSAAGGRASRCGPSTSASRSCGIDQAAIGGTRSPLGLRGIRLSLTLDEIFQAQLRALLRAAVHGPLRIMFPFVSGVEELRAGRAAVGARGRNAAAPAARTFRPCRSAS